MNGKESGLVSPKLGEIIKKKLSVAAQILDEKFTPVKFPQKTIDTMRIEKEQTEEYSI